MDIVRMVWHCNDCDKDFNKSAGERHHINSDHTLIRKLRGIEKKIENQYLIKDDVQPILIKKDLINICKPVEKKEPNYSIRSEAPKDSNKKLDKNIKGLSFELKQYIQEEREWQEKFLKWIRMRRDILKICDRFGGGLCQREN